MTLQDAAKECELAEYPWKKLTPGRQLLGPGMVSYILKRLLPAPAPCTVRGQFEMELEGCDPVAGADVARAIRRYGRREHDYILWLKSTGRGV